LDPTLLGLDLVSGWLVGLVIHTYLHYFLLSVSLSRRAPGVGARTSNRMPARHRGDRRGTSCHNATGSRCDGAWSLSLWLGRSPMRIRRDARIHRGVLPFPVVLRRILEYLNTGDLFLNKVSVYRLCLCT